MDTGTPSFEGGNLPQASGLSPLSVVIQKTDSTPLRRFPSSGAGGVQVVRAGDQTTEETDRPIRFPRLHKKSWEPHEAVAFSKPTHPDAQEISRSGLLQLRSKLR